MCLGCTDQEQETGNNMFINDKHLEALLAAAERVLDQAGFKTLDKVGYVSGSALLGLKTATIQVAQDIMDDEEAGLGAEYGEE